MRSDDLREATKERAKATANKLSKRLSKGEKSNRKRMATVASVYSISRHRRTAQDIVSDLSNVRKLSKAKRPKPFAKRTWASIEKDHGTVVSDMFIEGLR